MPTGTVRSYNASKGFGLITPDLGGPPVFVRKSEIHASSVGRFKALQRVSYDVHSGSEGLYACGVNVVGQ